jgi:hypothetical protein
VAAALCPRCEAGSECGGSELASQMEAAEDSQGGGVLFIGGDVGEVGGQEAVGEVRFNYQRLPEMGRGNEWGSKDLMGEEERSQQHFVRLTPWCAGGRPAAQGIDQRPTALLPGLDVGDDRVGAVWATLPG